MLNRIEQSYFRLLRMALWGREGDAFPALEIQPDEWPLLLRLAERQGTAPMLYDILLQEEHEGITAAMQQQMKAVSAHCMMMQQQQRAVREQATRALNAQGIKVVQLKGMTLSRHYPKPYLRSCGDVDIFVGKENYHAGARVLRETFPDAPRFDTEEDYFRHYNINVGPVPVEMHRVSHSFSHPRDERLYDRLEQEALHCNPYCHTDEEGSWLEPAEDFNVLFVFLHSWEHFVTETASIRQFTDLAMLLRNTQTPHLEAYLKKNLRRLHVLHAWQLYAYILVNYIGLPVTACPLYTDGAAERAELLLERILRGAPGRYTEKNASVPKNILGRKLYTFKVRTRDAKAIARFEPHYARHMVITNIVQSLMRFLKGQNTRHWE